jgi:hypothetical protein
MRAASIADSNAPFAAEVQSNMSNVIAGSTRYHGAASLSRPQEHPAYGTLHRTVAASVRGLLALGGNKEAPAGSWHA